MIISSFNEKQVIQSIEWLQ